MTTLIYRKKDPSFNSIENVFNALLPYFGNLIIKVELPFNNSGVINRFKNIWHVKRLAKNSFIHITGHDHYLALGLKKDNTILTIHDIEFIKRNQGLKRYLLQKLWMDYPIAKVKLVTTVSEFSKQEILRLNNYKTPIHVIHNPLTLKIESKLKTFNHDFPTILQIGTKENKNIYRLIDALKGIKCHLVIISRENKEIVDALEKNQISYSFKSNLSNEEIIEEYYNCDLVSFISTYEGFGLPIIEAQAAGRVVITSNVASMPEVAGDGALLVNPFKVNEINNGIRELINNDNLREALIKKGLENVKRFEPQKIANQYLELYNQVLNEN
ncbi:MAG: glycosyltransferase family 4 protein [Flavobacteriales bacterium]|nr:glycosyltransferase family 4 protein [Flavobacteriales bacterium]